MVKLTNFSPKYLGLGFRSRLGRVACGMGDGDTFGEGSIGVEPVELLGEGLGEEGLWCDGEVATGGECGEGGEVVADGEGGEVAVAGGKGGDGEVGVGMVV